MQATRVSAVCSGRKGLSLILCKDAYPSHGGSALETQSSPKGPTFQHRHMGSGLNMGTSGDTQTFRPHHLLRGKVTSVFQSGSVKSCAVSEDLSWGPFLMRKHFVKQITISDTMLYKFEFLPMCPLYMFLTPLSPPPAPVAPMDKAKGDEIEGRGNGDNCT